MLAIGLPVSLSAYSDWVVLSVVSEISSRRPVPNRTTRCTRGVLTPATVSFTRHWVTSGRLVIGWPLPASPILTTPTTPAVLDVRSKRQNWPWLSPP